MQHVCILLQHKAHQPSSITPLHPQQLSDTLAMLLAQPKVAVLQDPVTRCCPIGHQVTRQPPSSGSRVQHKGNSRGWLELPRRQQAEEGRRPAAGHAWSCTEPGSQHTLATQNLHSTFSAVLRLTNKRRFELCLHLENV